MTRNEARPTRRFVRKLVDNWHWGMTHGWVDLIEEHDVNPFVRGRRAFRKARWRWTNRLRGERPTPVFLIGAQRSGTNMMVHGLDELAQVQVYNEGNAKAFENFRLRPLETIEALVERSWAEFVVFKPLCDAHRAVELLDNFAPRARVIWAYRAVEGRVRSAVAKFGDSNLRVLRAYAAGEAGNAWQVQGVSSENADFIKSFDLDRLSAESGAALFWYVRNSLYFEMSLDGRENVMLLSYDQLLADPEGVAASVCRFVGLDYRRDLIAHIKPHRHVVSKPLEIDSRIRERCEELQERLDRSALDTSRVRSPDDRTAPRYR